MLKDARNLGTTESWIYMSVLKEKGNKKAEEEQTYVILLTLEQSSDLVNPNPFVETVIRLIGAFLLGGCELDDCFSREIRVGGIMDSFEDRREEGGMSRERGHPEFVHGLASERVESCGASERGVVYSTANIIESRLA
jgi:hypothetical protein